MPDPYSARDVIKVLTAHGWRRVESGGGSHEKFVYTDPNTGEKRVVTVPLHEEIARAPWTKSRGRPVPTTYKRSESGWMRASRPPSVPFYASPSLEFHGFTPYDALHLAASAGDIIVSSDETDEGFAPRLDLRAVADE